MTVGRGRWGKGRVGTIARFARPYRRRALLALFTLIVATAASVSGPVVAKEVIDSGIRSGNYDIVVLWVCVFLVVALVGWMATAAQSYLTSWVGERVLADLRVAVFGHVQRLDLGFFERTPAGVVISRLT
ncbi:MAG TPA: ABC transporter transmembrane domain-containing protein, partial [Gaiellales bacterium]|nr:ABC transporter transmembrane domain-containing protein [Gaiellales bacterium]